MRKTNSLPANRPNHRPAAGGLLLALLLVGFLIPMVSAETVIDEHLSTYVDTSGSGVQTPGGTYAGGTYIRGIRTLDITQLNHLSYIVLEMSGNHGAWINGSTLQNGRSEFSYSFNGATRPGVVYVARQTNLVGAVTSTKFTIFLNEWDTTGLTGSQSISLPFKTYIGVCKNDGSRPTRFYLYGGDSGDRPYPGTSVSITISSGILWENDLNVIDDASGYQTSLTRTVNGKAYKSTLNLSNDGNVIHSSTLSGGNESHWHPKTGLDLIEVIAPDGQQYTYPIGGGPSGSDTATATVYVQSSQTGALLANAHLSILAAVGDPVDYYEVVNATLPGGTGTYTLQPTGTADPYPLYYRANATVPGYSQIIENHSFTLTGPHDVIIEMRPDNAGPTDPENCYLEFYVRDLNANSIPSASIQCNNQIKTTNSAGYAVFEVTKNASYPYKVSKSGYVTIEGTATVEALPRYVANIVLGPGTVPTHTPTLGPGETPTVPGATPTLPPGRIISDDDRRRSENQIIDMIYVFGVPIAIFALIGTLMYLVGAGTGGGRSRRRRR